MRFWEWLTEDVDVPRWWLYSAYFSLACFIFSVGVDLFA